ncbi:Transposase, Mutator family [Streptomyces lavendulae subsp. lavendulae]|uniref:Mutator family transposase n=1 Tax=Streptomyces lavendulae subsp. lavendulae TaxID=58340 RepID=A0A2K8PRA8_STRLA|nr:Transposase, Mutator family [Streptomyces lavendulae subsp. lavendulae]QUQ59100.1 hypothetical protein SLLC_35765 [Streptomyces lavendulae subsp. lavendulae]
MDRPRVKRIDEATGERKRFSSVILPPWCRKSPKISEVLPLLYLHGLSSGDFVPALEQFLGSSAGLSPATVTRLTAQWQADHKAFSERDLSATDYVYVWADGIHLRIRLEEANAHGAEGHPGHLQRRGQEARGRRGRGVRQAVRREVPQGRQEDRR